MDEDPTTKGLGLGKMSAAGIGALGKSGVAQAVVADGVLPKDFAVGARIAGLGELAGTGAGIAKAMDAFTAGLGPVNAASEDFTRAMSESADHIGKMFDRMTEGTELLRKSLEEQRGGLLAISPIQFPSIPDVPDYITHADRLLEMLPPREELATEATMLKMTEAIVAVQQSVLTLTDATIAVRESVDSQKVTIHREEVAIKRLTWALVVLTVALVAFEAVPFVHELRAILR